MGLRLIENGTVINAGGRVAADVLIKDGKIAAIGSELRKNMGLLEKDTDIVDAKGMYVLPGAIDSHTHLEMEMMGGKTMSADTYATGSAAAAFGGVTTFIDYTLQEKGGSILQEIKNRRALCKNQAYVDYSFHGGISDVNEKSLKEMAKVVEYGVPSFKVYMVYDFGLNDAEIYKVLKRAGELNAIITVHAENRGMIEAKNEEFRKAGTTDAYHHYLSRPECVEEEADNRLLIMARELGVPVYIVHLANEAGVKLVTEARRAGRKVYVETCPQYLKFTNEVYKGDEGCRFICSPPIKGKASRDALWEAVNSGNVDILATDHCPSKLEEKHWGDKDYTKAPNGLMGIENMYPYMLSCAGEGKLTFEKAVAVCSANPARIFGMGERKGRIAPGYDADIVLYNPKKKVTVSAADMHSLTDYSVWEGTKLKGYPVSTLVRGEFVVKNGELVGKPGYGRFVERHTI